MKGKTKFGLIFLVICLIIGLVLISAGHSSKRMGFFSRIGQEAVGAGIIVLGVLVAILCFRKPKQKEDKKGKAKEPEA